MSESFIRLVPVDPHLVPNAEWSSKARDLLLAAFPEAESVQILSSENVRFVDAGENWDGVSCSACGADAIDWWANAMDEAFSKQFASLEVTAPCCGNVVNLNSLNYGWPVAFGRTVFEVANPNVSELEPELLARVSAVIGSELRVVWVHM